MEKTLFDWCSHFLTQAEYILEGSFEPVRIVPWSAVYRLSTDKGFVYLKKMAKPFSIEASLIQSMTQSATHLLPTIIGIHPTLSCFIMKDAGFVLRERLKQQYDIHLVANLISDYAKLQIVLSSRLDEFLKMGVLDWRIEKLPCLYSVLLSKKDFLQEDGLTRSDIEKLFYVEQKFSEVCGKISQFQIPATIEHADFQDNNFLIDTKVIINDWGDAVISHPFFSLLSFFNSAQRHHNMREQDISYQQLKESYLKNWTQYETQERLEEAFALAKLLHPIQFVASFLRITECDEGKIPTEYHGTVANRLRTFIEALTSTEY